MPMRKTILFALTLLCLAVASCDNVYTTNVMLINQSDSIITVYKGDKEVVTSMPAPTKGADAAMLFSPIAPHKDKLIYTSGETKGFMSPWELLASYKKKFEPVTLRIKGEPLDIDLTDEHSYQIISMANYTYDVLITISNADIKKDDKE